MHKHIRTIFSVFALIMIVAFGMRLWAGVWSPLNWAMVVVSAVMCVLVFRCFVYVFNFSYALASLLNGLLLAAVLQTPAAYLLGGAMALYGARLLWFTWSRVRSASYAQRAANIDEANAAMPGPIKVALWLQCTFLYTFHLFAVYLAGSIGALTVSTLAGAALIFLGLIIETVADAQKQAGKAVAASSFVNTGLYARWRHPNYIGEIIVQLGLIVAGIGAAAAMWGNLVAAIAAPLYITLLMLAECVRADESMQLRYGEREDFRAYLARSGSILPRL
jgi:steroid 5-alpha reductase family enzyme